MQDGWLEFNVRFQHKYGYLYQRRQRNAEALYRWSEETMHHLISYFLSNTSAKNYPNQIVYVKIIASQRRDVFLR